MSPTFNPPLDCVSIVVEGRVVVVFVGSCGFDRYRLRWIYLNPVFGHVSTGLIILIYASSSVLIVVLLRWSCEALGGGLPNCLQEGLPGSGERGAITEAHLRLAPMFVVVTWWSTNPIVIFIIFSVLCIIATDDE